MVKNEGTVGLLTCGWCLLFLVPFLAVYYGIKDGLYDDCMDDWAYLVRNDTLINDFTPRLFDECVEEEIAICPETSTLFLDCAVSALSFCNVSRAAQAFATEEMCSRDMVQVGNIWRGWFVLGAHPTEHANCVMARDELLAQRKHYQTEFTAAVSDYTQQAHACLAAFDEAGVSQFSVCMHNSDDTNPDHDYFCSKYAVSEAGLWASVAALGFSIVLPLLCFIFYMTCQGVREGGKRNGLLLFMGCVSVMVTIAIPMVTYGYQFYDVWESEYEECYLDSDLGYVYCTRVSDAKAAVEASWSALLVFLIFMCLWWIFFKLIKAREESQMIEIGVFVLVALAIVCACFLLPYFHFYEEQYRDCRNKGREDHYCNDDALEKAEGIAIGIFLAGCVAVVVLGAILYVLAVKIDACFSDARASLKARFGDSSEWLSLNH